MRSALPAASLARPCPQYGRASRQPISTQGENGSARRGTESPTKPMNSPGLDQLGRPVAPAAGSELGLPSVDAGIAGGSTLWRGEELHDGGIGVHGGERLAIGIPPLPHPQARCLELDDPRQGSGSPSGGLTLVQKLRVEITWRRDRDRLEHLADISPVIPAVSENVKKDLFSGHASLVAVGKGEVQDLASAGSETEDTYFTYQASVSSTSLWSWASDGVVFVCVASKGLGSLLRWARKILSTT